MTTRESVPDRPRVGRTLAGLLVGGAVFLGLGLYLNVATGFSATDNPGPVAVLGLIGATVGGLVAPLLSSLVRRRRGGRNEAG